MKYKTKAGVEIELHEQDIKAISKMYNEEEFKFEDMEEYFKDLHKHAISKMEHVSDLIITDEDSIDIAAEYVAKNGTYKDFVKFLRYYFDWDISYHLLESVK